MSEAPSDGVTSDQIREQMDSAMETDAGFVRIFFPISDVTLLVLLMFREYADHQRSVAAGEHSGSTGVQGGDSDNMLGVAGNFSVESFKAIRFSVIISLLKALSLRTRM